MVNPSQGLVEGPVWHRPVLWQGGLCNVRSAQQPLMSAATGADIPAARLSQLLQFNGIVDFGVLTYSLNHAFPSSKVAFQNP
eukprot:2125869-Amphidinium_carterae.1